MVPCLDRDQGQVVSPRGKFWELFIIFINNIDNGVECTLNKFVDGNGIKLWGVVNTLEGWDAIQSDLDKLEQWCVWNKSYYLS